MWNTLWVLPPYGNSLDEGYNQGPARLSEGQSPNQLSDGHHRVWTASAGPGNSSGNWKPLRGIQGSPRPGFGAWDSGA